MLYVQNFTDGPATQIQFKVDSEWQIIEKRFHGNFIHSQSFLHKSVERQSPKEYFNIFRFVGVVGPGA